MATSSRFRPSGATSVPPLMTSSAMRALQLIYEMQARRNGRRNVFFENRFVRMMADATRTPQEQNRCGHPLRHNHGIVTRPAVHSLFRVTALPYRAGEHLD